MTKLKLHHMDIFTFRDNNDYSEDWRTPSEFVDLEKCGRAGRTTIKVRVAGYWSSDVITIYVERKGCWDSADGSDGAWEVSISHSSGGRLTRPDEKNYPSEFYKAVASDIDAESNFGLALIAAAGVARQILDHTEELEQAWQLQQEERRQREAEEAAARQAKFDADMPMGPVEAKRLYGQAAQLGMWSERRIVVYQRGAEHPAWLTVRRNQNISLQFMGGKISRDKALALLAESSRRSYLADTDQQ